MAIIDDTFDPGPSWATYLTEYQISFTEEEERVLEKYNDPEFARSHNAWRGGVDNGDNPIRNFEILWLSNNPVARLDEFKSLRETFLELSYHYLSEVYQFDVPDEFELAICDSWFLHLRGDETMDGDFQPFRRHNHSFAMLSGVLYLDDSSNGLKVDEPDGTDSPFFPIIFDKKPERTNFSGGKYFECRRGKIIMFPGKVFHELVQSNNENDFRRSLVFNVWPTGVVSRRDSGLLLTEDLNNGHSMSMAEYRNKHGENDGRER